MASIKLIDFRTATDLTNHEKTRIQRLVENFERITGTAAKYCIKLPGRVNLIGDHIDYHGFSVLPMAIANSVLVCLSTTDSVPNTVALKSVAKGDSKSFKQKSLIILNVDEETFPAHSCEHSLSYGAVLDTSHQWYHYVLCGYHGILTKKFLQLESNQIYEHAKCLANNQVTGTNGDHKNHDLTNKRLDDLDHMILLVDSDLPPASGLSSSSALVCASALATYIALGEQKTGSCDVDPDLVINSEELAEDCANFEHLVGTRGGGMDQAVILTAQAGYAKNVEFMPQFKCINVYLPRGVVWLVSHCGVSHPKAATSQFNSRVLETKLAAALILKMLKPASPTPLDHSITLCKVKHELIGYESPAAELLSIIEEKVFDGEKCEMSLDEFSSHLNISRADLITKFKTSEDFLVRSGLNSKLSLLKRCRHILDESDRVRKFKIECETTQNFRRLGELMTESHISLRDNYECSHPALDNLVNVALNAGVLGARLTGAGWGGCIVSLVESCKSEHAMKALEKVSKFTFRTEPQSGASIFKLI